MHFISFGCREQKEPKCVQGEAGAICFDEAWKGFRAAQAWWFPRHGARKGLFAPGALRGSFAFPHAVCWALLSTSSSEATLPLGDTSQG